MNFVTVKYLPDTCFYCKRSLNGYPLEKILSSPRGQGRRWVDFHEDCAHKHARQMKKNGTK